MGRRSLMTLLLPTKGRPGFGGWGRVDRTWASSPWNESSSTWNIHLYVTKKCGKGRLLRISSRRASIIAQCPDGCESPADAGFFVLGVRWRYEGRQFSRYGFAFTPAFGRVEALFTPANKFAGDPDCARWLTQGYGHGEACPRPGLVWVAPSARYLIVPQGRCREREFGGSG